MSIQLDEASASFAHAMVKARAKPISEMTPTEFREGSARLKQIICSGLEMARKVDQSLGDGDQDVYLCPKPSPEG